MKANRVLKCVVIAAALVLSIGSSALWGQSRRERERLLAPFVGKWYAWDSLDTLAFEITSKGNILLGVDRTNLGRATIEAQGRHLGQDFFTGSRTVYYIYSVTVKGGTLTIYYDTGAYTNYSGGSLRAPSTPAPDNMPPKIIQIYDSSGIFVDNSRRFPILVVEADVQKAAQLQAVIAEQAAKEQEAAASRAAQAAASIARYQAQQAEKQVQADAALAEKQQADLEASRQQIPPEDAFMVKQNEDNTITITGYRGTAKNIIIPDTLYGLKVTVIGERAFYNEGLTGVVIPNTVTTIGERAFAEEGNYKASLRVVTIGNAVKIIDTEAFANSALTEVIIPDSVIEIGPKAFSVENFLNNHYEGTLAKVQLGRGLKTIYWNAFYGQNITSLVIPNGVVFIGASAFGGNPLTELVIPSSLASSYAEEKVTMIIVGDTMVRTAGISEDAFTGPLVRVTIPANMDERNMATFEESLVNFWKSQNKAAGTYVKNGPIWTRQR